MLRKFLHRDYLKQKRRKLRRGVWQRLKKVVSRRFAYSAEIGFERGYRAYREAKQEYRFFRHQAVAAAECGPNDLAPLEYHALPGRAEGQNSVRDGVLQPAPREDIALAIVCAFRGRHPVLELVLAEALAAPDSAGIRWMLCGSTREDWEFIQRQHQKDPRVTGIIVENQPLGRKWQTAMVTAHRLYNARRFAITGSDDVLTAGLVGHAVARGAAGPGETPLMGCFEWLMYARNPLPQFYHCQYDTLRLSQPLGAGRFYDGAFVDALEGQLFDSSRHSGLDDRGFSEVISRGYGTELLLPQEHAVISVKGSWQQLNPADKVLSAKGLAISESSFASYTRVRDQMSAEGFRHLIRSDFRNA